MQTGQPRHLRGERGQEGDEAPHGVADDEERDPGVLVHLLPAVLDHGVSELPHVPDQGPLPLTLTVTHMVMAKHKEPLRLAHLSQFRVAGNKMLSVPGNRFLCLRSHRRLQLIQTRELGTPVL